MLSRIVGKFVEINENTALVDINGLGYEVEVPPSTFDDVSSGTKCTLYVHEVIQQDAHTLYGFTNNAMRDFFRILIKIPSVGPRSALAILSTYSLEQLNRIAQDRDIGFLTRVKGIGKRGAERIVVDLANRLDDLPLAVSSSIDQSSDLNEAERALVNLGYRQGDARRAVEANWHDGISIEDLVRAALRHLASTK
ncbi:MAG: Holliday junction branch migration protein RuvA [Gammaproteobacteria bacterium]|nr:Holliday junction branch migration protein RuvA [Gammaproteobacteria bacterium]MYC25196.1 Holliday junction branch migration protein RuvA [Gammaproteobacteria bacterium]